MPTRPIDAASADAVSAEYSGKWVAWTADHLRIVAEGETIAELWQTVQDQGIVDPVFEKVPRFDVRFVGMR